MIRLACAAGLTDARNAERLMLDATSNSAANLILRALNKNPMVDLIAKLES